MPDEPQNTNQRHQFAVAMALGQSVAVWAKANGVPLSTCYDWREAPEYKDTVEEVLRRVLDSAVGQLVGNLTKATRRIVDLSSAAESESVQLQAACAIVKECMALREHVDLEDRMTEVELRLEELETDTAQPYPSANGSYN